MMISSRFTRWLTVVALAATVAVALPARANTWPLPPAGSNVVGENRFHVVENDGGSLEAIAKKYNVGFLALLQANPGVDPYVPRAGSVLTIPLQTILPDAPRQGIVINLAELRLYYYPPGKNEVTVYPIGIGQLGGDTLTPTMVTTVSDKRESATPGHHDCRRGESRAAPADGRGENLPRHHWRSHRHRYGGARSDGGAVAGSGG